MSSFTELREAEVIKNAISFSERRFSIGEIIEATNNFDPKTIFTSSDDLGFTMYVANISNSSRSGKSVESDLAYVKRFSKYRSSFPKEVGVMTKIQKEFHANLLLFYGCCVDSGEKILVYKYMENGCLADYLNKRHKIWSWKKRVTMCLNIAYGLRQLHTTNSTSPYGISHGVLKTADILVDKNWNPLISNFNNSGDYTRNLSSTHSDVHELGTILIDVLCWNNQSSRAAFDRKHEKDFTILAKKKLANGIGDEISPDSLNAFSDAIWKCSYLNVMQFIHFPPPTEDIDEVVFHLEAALKSQELFERQRIPTTVDLLSSSSRTKRTITVGGLTLSSESFSLFSCRQFSFKEIKDATNKFEVKIGEGGEAKVYLGEINLAGKTEEIQVAVKLYNTGNIVNFEEEIETMTKVKHPNIVSLIGYCRESDCKALIYEYMGNGSLFDYVKMDGKHCLTWKQRLKICLGAAYGLQHLHRETTESPYGIVHRDVKPANILISDNWTAKVSDFGLLKVSNAGQTRSTLYTNHYGGTHGYSSPECSNPYSGIKITRKADVFSFGLVMFEVLCLQKIWKIAEDKSIYLGINMDVALLANENIDIKIKDKISEASKSTFIDIIVESMQIDPKERPSMNNVVRLLEAALKCQAE